MAAQILNGKNIAADIRTNLADKINSSNFEEIPVLAVIKVGDNEGKIV